MSRTAILASFLLAWAAEAAQKDISGALAIALLALIAVLPVLLIPSSNAAGAEEVADLAVEAGVFGAAEDDQ